MLGCRVCAVVRVMRFVGVEVEAVEFVEAVGQGQGFLPHSCHQSYQTNWAYRVQQTAGSSTPYRIHR